MGEYLWKDTNLALIGSDEDKKFRKHIAEYEPAWKNVESINCPTLIVWRVKNFGLEPVATKDHGKFYNGDSYIVLKAEKKGNKLVYNIHFWIGRYSTQDEYGTAAYKTVELDALLLNAAIQHREVDGYESKMFSSYFTKIEKLTGGYPSGFRNSEKGIFKPRLLVFHGVDNKHTVLTEVPFARKAVSSDDVFVLDLGIKAYQWNGNGANKDERYRASLYLQQLKSERLGRCQTFVVDESDGEGTAEFFSHLPDAALPRSKAEQGVGRRAIYRLSDETGKLKVTLMCEDRLDKSVLTQDDAYFIDTGKALFVYIGEKCSRNEKRNAFSYANAYLKQTNHPFVPITVVSGNMDSDELAQVLE
ncbi:unnamed protein product [Calicophoron daubneyi]|uniref:Gelsolin-like domain-containing protein n=1 Tax=Calicophoron daubneyi TaxID=300641 RepID=A0AAV2T7J7_CALDB